MGERQGQHEGIGIDGLTGEMQQAAERDRQHENIDQQEVEREQPDGTLEVRLVNILDNNDLELARQEDDGQTGKQDQRGPRAGTCRIRLHQARQFGRGSGACEEIGKAVEHAISHEQADGEEGEQLDHRLKGDRRDHAFVALGRIEMACPEPDGEQRQHGGNQQRRIQPPGQQAVPVTGKQHINAGGDCLQLQGDVRHHPDNCDHGDQPGQQLALAVARGDEIGNRGDALHLADPDHFQDDAGEQQHQGRTEIDGEEGQAARSRPPDAAVKGP